MNIIKLSAENVKRISAVEITPAGAVVVISGKNGAGKSSVLDAIAMALGGAALVPAKPIRAGQDSATVRVDLGDLIVTRHFTAKTSTLVVTNKEGAKYPSPQSILDRLGGVRTFDPLAFQAMAPKDQRITLCEIVGVDTAELDATRLSVYQQRTALNAQIKAEDAVIASIPFHAKAPDEEVSIAALTEELAAAEDARTESERAMATVSRLKTLHENAVSAVNATDREIAAVVRQLEACRGEAGRLRQIRDDLSHQVSTAETALRPLAEAVPDTGAIRARMVAAEQTNLVVRSNLNRNKKVQELFEKITEARELTTVLDELDAAKQQALSTAVYPVPGLSVDDEGVLLNGIPFAQASTAERLRVSVAIGLALNPTLKVLLIREGSALDHESMTLLAEMAEAAGAQIWLERVADSADGVSIYIEDGTVRQGGEA